MKSQKWIYLITCCVLSVSLFSQSYRLLVPRQHIRDVVQSVDGALWYTDSEGRLYRHNSHSEQPFTEPIGVIDLVQQQSDIYVATANMIWKLEQDEWHIWLNWTNGVIRHIEASDDNILVITNHQYYTVDKEKNINSCKETPEIASTVNAVYHSNQWYVAEANITRSICQPHSSSILSNHHIIDLLTQGNNLIAVSENRGFANINKQRVTFDSISTPFAYCTQGAFVAQDYVSISPSAITVYDVQSDDYQRIDASQFRYCQATKDRLLGYDKYGIAHFCSTETGLKPSFNLTKIAINNNTIPLQSKLTLQPNDILTLDAESLYWGDKSKPKYYYRLPPQQDTWIEWDIRKPLNITVRQDAKKLELQEVFDNQATRLLDDPIAFHIPLQRNDTLWYIIGGLLLLLTIVALLSMFRFNTLKKEHQKTISRIELQRRVAEEQLKTMQLQMNPHFLFNVLNSIQGLIALDQPKDARRNINKFAQLMRGILNQSNQEATSLRKELDLLKQYLELEQLCRPDKFDFDIKVSSDVDTDVNIPSMLLQPFLENAIIHGVKWLKHKGNITLSIENNPNGLLCTITDNGIGREAAAEHKQSEHQSYGTTIVQNRLREYFKFKNVEPVKYLDLTNPTGTQAEVLIPIL